MKLLISDYDYTMYDGIDQKCIEKNVEAINKFIKNGNMFVIATGRAFNTIKEESIKYGIPYNYLICQVGTSIFDANDNLLFFNPLRKEYISKVLNYLNNQCGIKRIRQVNYLGKDTNIANETTEIYCEFEENEENYKIVSKILEETKNIGIQVINFTKENTIYIIFKEYMHKAIGINNLLNIIHFPKENVYTIGDESNDLEMLKEYNGFRVSNSSQILKEENIPEVESVRKLIKRIESE